MSGSSFSSTLSAPLDTADAIVPLSVESDDEVSRLRAIVLNLHSALGVALFRLEEGGLAHQDLRAPLQEAGRLFTHDASDDGEFEDVPTGPFIFGTLNEVPDVAGSVRFVFDLGTDRIARLEVKLASRWENAEPALIESFRTWLLEENEDMIDHPENWELGKSDSLPIWTS